LPLGFPKKRDVNSFVQRAAVPLPDVAPGL